MSLNSARVKNDWGSVPLHDVSKALPDVIQMLIEACPEALQKKDDEGSLPLHTVCMRDASTDIVKMIFEAYPKAIEIKDNYGDLPIHYACRHAAFPDVKMIYDAYPEAAEVHNINEQLPRHVACQCSKGTDSAEVMDLLLLAYPGGINVEDQNGELISDCLNHPKSSLTANDVRKAIICGFSTALVKLLLKAFPESCMEQDENGMIPLHYACASNSSHFIEYVVALLDVENKESLTVQDNIGRTLLQILASTASRQDKNRRFPLHCLAAASNNLCPKSLQLLVDIYPESITSVDKFCLLPFHYACLNPATSIVVMMLFISLSPEVVGLPEKSHLKNKQKSNDVSSKSKMKQRKRN